MEHLTRGDIFLACFAAAGVMAAAIIGVLVTFHLQNRKDAKTEKGEREKSTEQLLYRIAEYSLHSHQEFNDFAKPTDVLTVQGLRFPRNGNK